MQKHGLAAITGSGANSAPANDEDPKEMWHKALASYLNCL
jgi:hypothetical protein